MASLDDDELRIAAEAGEVAAQIELGTRLGDCVGRDRDTYAAFLLRHPERALGGSSARRHGSPGSFRVTTAIKTFEQQLVETCAAFDPVEIVAHHVWLERAARSGNIAAKRAYARYALREFSDRLVYRAPQESGRSTLLANLPEVIRRRDLAREWAEDAVRAGDVEMLSDLAAAYGRAGALDGLVPPDPVRWAIYGHAAELAVAWHSPQQVGGLEDAWRHGPERSDALTDAQWEDAARQARILYLRWYGEAPDGH